MLDQRETKIKANWHRGREGKAVVAKTTAAQEGIAIWGYVEPRTIYYGGG